MQAASIRYVRSWEECVLNADMAFWAAIDPKVTSAFESIEVVALTMLVIFSHNQGATR